MSTADARMDRKDPSRQRYVLLNPAQFPQGPRCSSTPTARSIYAILIDIQHDALHIYSDRSDTK